MISVHELVIKTSCSSLVFTVEYARISSARSHVNFKESFLEQDIKTVFIVFSKQLCCLPLKKLFSNPSKISFSFVSHTFLILVVFREVKFGRYKD